MAVTVLTQGGIAAVLAAGTGGPLINVTQAKLGSTTNNPDPSMTNVSGSIVHTTSNIQYQILDSNTIQYSFVLDASVGTFSFGNVGLFLDDGTMFAITSYESTINKIHTIADTQQGNRIVIRIQIRVANLVGITNLTVLVAEECSIPEVANQGALPSAGSAPFNLYLVRSHSGFAGRATLAMRVSGAWSYIPADNGSGGALVETNGMTMTGLFDGTVDAGETVYWDVGGAEFLPAESGTAAKRPIGIRGTSDMLHMAGSVYTHGSNIYTTGQVYYQHPSTPGALTTTPNDYRIGRAIAQNKLLVDLGITIDPIVGGGGYTPVGKKSTTYLPATAWYPTKRVGNDALLKWITPVDLDRPTFPVWEFPKSTIKVIETESYLVKSINKDVPMEFYVKWLRPAATGSNDVVWKVRAIAIHQGIATNVSFAAAVTVMDSAASADVIYTSAVISVDLAGFQPETTIHFQVTRDIDNVADKFVQQVYFHSAFVKYQALLDTDA